MMKITITITNSSNLFKLIILALLYYGINQLISYLGINYLQSYFSIEFQSLFFSFILIFPIFFLYKKKKKYNLIIHFKRINFFRFIIVFAIFYFLTGLFDPFFYISKKDIFICNANLIVTHMSLLMMGIIIVPFQEEIFFRGLLLEYAKNYKAVFGIILTSFLYSITHFSILYTQINYSNIIYFIHLFILGILLAITRIRYGLAYSIFGHMIYNLIPFTSETNVCDLYFLDYIRQPIFYWGFYVSTIIIIILYILKLYKK